MKIKQHSENGKVLQDQFSAEVSPKLLSDKMHSKSVDDEISSQRDSTFSSTAEEESIANLTRQNQDSQGRPEEPMKLKREVKSRVYLSPIKDLKQTAHLVMGPGARKWLLGGAGIALPKLTDKQSAAVQNAKKYAMEQSVKLVLMKQTYQHQQVQSKSLQKQQVLLVMCQVYVGSINFDVQEETIRKAFLPFGPIRTVHMSFDQITQRHMGFAFVHFDMPESAQLSLDQMNGVVMSGRNIKVGRPSNMPQVQADIDEIVREAENYNRIYISSIHADLTSQDIQSVFEAFGSITSCDLPMSSIPGKHKGYCYVEYKSSHSCNDAVASMNLFDLGGQYLRVGRAITPPELNCQSIASHTAVNQTLPVASAVAAAAATAKIQAMDAVATNLGLPSGIDPTSESTTPKLEINTVSTEKFTVPYPPSNPILSDPSCKEYVGLPLPAVVTLEDIGGKISTSAEKSSTKNFSKINSKEQENADHLHKKFMEGQEPTTIAQQENIEIKGQSARHLVMQRLMRETPESVVVVLKNMVNPDEVDEELQGEIEDECGKNGETERVIIYQEKQDESENAEIVVKIFVEFKDSISAKKAKEAFHNRYFGGKVICAQIYDQELYNNQDLSG